VPACCEDVPKRPAASRGREDIKLLINPFGLQVGVAESNFCPACTDSGYRGPGGFGQVEPVTISGHFKEQPQACAGRRPSSRTETVTSSLRHTRAALPGRKPAEPQALTGESRAGRDSASAAPR